MILHSFNHPLNHYRSMMSHCITAPFTTSFKTCCSTGVGDSPDLVKEMQRLSNRSLSAHSLSDNFWLQRKQTKSYEKTTTESTSSNL